MAVFDTYKINTLDLWLYFSLRVQTIGGVFDFPVRGGDTERDWFDEDGLEAFVDADDIWFKQRTIVLKCLMQADDKSDFMTKLSMFKDQVYSGVCDLETPYGTFKVLLKKGAKVNYIRNGKAEFELEFTETEYSKKAVPTGFHEGVERTIDGILWNDLGISIQYEYGQFDFTAMKRDKNTVYKTESAVNNMRYSRNITVGCFLQADSLNKFVSNINDLHGLLANEGMRQLILSDIEKPFQVLVKDGFKLKKLYRDNGKFCAEFDIRFFEARPKKESIVLTILADTLGNIITDTLGRSIVIIWDKSDLAGGPVYLFLDEECEDDTFLYTDEELNNEDPVFDPDAEPIYLFKDNELTS